MDAAGSTTPLTHALALPRYAKIASQTHAVGRRPLRRRRRRCVADYIRPELGLYRHDSTKSSPRADNEIQNGFHQGRTNHAPDISTNLFDAKNRLPRCCFPD